MKLIKKKGYENTTIRMLVEDGKPVFVVGTLGGLAREKLITAPEDENCGDMNLYGVIDKNGRMWIATTMNKAILKAGIYRKGAEQ